MGSVKNRNRCIICRRPGKAKLNGAFWLCCEHAHGVVVASLMIGQPVMEAVRGEPRYLLMPTIGINKN